MARYFGGPAIDEPRAMTLDGGGLEAAASGLGSVTGRDALVGRACRGDEPAFEALVAPCIEPSFRRALAILGNEWDARDAVQDALLNAWRGIHALRDADRFDAWFGRIVMNACRAVGRRRGRSRVREIRIDLVCHSARSSSSTTSSIDPSGRSPRPSASHRAP